MWVSSDCATNVDCFQDTSIPAVCCNFVKCPCTVLLIINIYILFVNGKNNNSPKHTMAWIDGLFWQIFTHFSRLLSHLHWLLLAFNINWQPSRRNRCKLHKPPVCRKSVTPATSTSSVSLLRWPESVNSTFNNVQVCQNVSSFIPHL